LFACVFVTDFEGALARRAEDEDCHGFPILYARRRLIAVGDVPILEEDADNGKRLNRPMLIWVGRSNRIDGGTIQSHGWGVRWQA